MDISSSQLAQATVLEIKGEIDHGNAGMLNDVIEEELDKGDAFLLLDLTNVGYIDSGGVSVLLSAVRRLRDQGWLGVINPNKNVKRLFEIVGLSIDESFRLFSTREEAESALTEFAGA